MICTPTLKLARDEQFITSCVRLFGFHILMPSEEAACKPPVMADDTKACGNQIRPQLSAASPTNRPQLRVTIMLELWPAGG